MIKLADTLAPMADFPAAMAEHVEFADGENLQQKLDDGSLGGGGGADGKSAYDIWLDEGNSGSEADFLNSLKGEKGDTGEKGTDGIDGYSPTVVENANNTEDNYKLDITTETTSYTTPNLKGKQGVQGLQGTRGEKGDKGDTGLTGEKGADGVSPIVTENADNSDTIYKLDIVDANGTHTTPNLIGRQGVQGLKGDKGDVGEKGEQGIQGIAGTDGVSPLITTNTANTEDVYKLNITDANGTFTTPNLIGRQGVQGIQGEKGEQGEQGIQGIQGIQGEKGEDGYPFLIYREYSSLDDFDPDHFPEIGLMFMIKAEDGRDNYPIYRYTGMVDTPYSFVTDLATSEGLKGEKGDKGDQGEQGIQGEKGADGITYTPVIGTVTTVGSTSDATADIVVDSVAKTATFNFAIPKGANGAIGGKGDKGEKGDTGEKGDAGVDGITYTPTIGTVLTVDSTSEASANVDIDTDNARATFNFSIPRGADGLQGLQGVQGLQGIQGEAGKDGEDGTTYTPSIGEVTTVDSTELASATVSIKEDTKEAVFNFAIPRGNKGLDGKDGVQISDNETVEDKTWSSKKTSDEIAYIESALDELENITRLTDFDEAIPEKGKNKIYCVHKSIGTYKCAQWRVESMYYDVTGAKQYRGVQKATSINGVDNIMLMREYYLDDNNVMRWGAWTELATMDKLNYSTTETPIGTWIDGKPIYRIYASFPVCKLKQNEWNIINLLSITGIDEVINARAKRSEDNAIIPLAARSIGTSIEVNPSTNFGISKLILEYTKH